MTARPAARPAASDTATDTVSTFTCASCEVTWTSYETACWMCGRDATASTLADPTRPPRTATPSTGSPSTGAPVHRMADILRAHAMGLPDPRYPARRTLA